MTSAPAAAAPQRPQAPVLDERIAAARMARVKKLVLFETGVIAVLALLLLVLLPFAAPVELYFAARPDGVRARMTGLSMPNMTDSAVLSWATTSITEIMTFGFGDMDAKLPRERVRFTKGGWEAFRAAFANGDIEKDFKQSQLVLTTVPSDTPVIVSQGVNNDRVYQWRVQMPVIMTYANTQVQQKRGLVSLTIVRVPAEDSAAGIAIRDWDVHS